ncbi:hypothetical protein QE152_g8952 [Popillia japonica]|uniref:Reverse transcriptase Ty1/copia-type domain-containing protein n=1 Tax=Popillia japonica TaxID=7064 RepID=A0AAW1M3Z8_POPJA
MKIINYTQLTACFLQKMEIQIHMTKLENQKNGGKPQKTKISHSTYSTLLPHGLPETAKTIDTAWVFRTKSDGTKKARLVAKGYQESSVAHVYAPVAKMATI